MKEEKSLTEKKRGSKKRAIAALFLIAGVVLIAVLAINFIRHRMAYAVTDAVFVRTDNLISVGFNRVSGRVQAVYKKEGEPMKKGEVLARIDDTTYHLTVQQLEARLAGMKEKKQQKTLYLRRLRQEISLNEEIAKSRVEELTSRKAAQESTAEAVQAEIDQLKRDNDRYQTLVATKAVSHSRAEDAATRLRARILARKALLEQIAALEASQVTANHQLELARVEKSKIQETEKETETLDEQIREQAAALAAARDDLAQCSLKSPISGRVAKRFISAGNLVSPQKVTFSLIDPLDIYVIALLEEQKLAGVVPGSPVRITIDAYPREPYEGEVESVLPASAATFALAPRDISAGEFTKVAQRIPVRIRITSGEIDRLRVGMGGEVEIRRLGNDHPVHQSRL